MADLALLQRLCMLSGVSGTEHAVLDAIYEEVKPYVDSAEVTPLHNLLVKKKGRSRAPVRLMLCAHMDEVGMSVIHITEHGLLKFALIGGINEDVLCGKSVLVGDRLEGVIGTKPIHLTEKADQKRVVQLKDLYIDIGAANKEEAEQVVSLGDPVTFAPFFEAKHGAVKGRALDDRAGCAILVDLIKSDLAYDMTFAFTSQEEIGLRGAKTAAYAVAPQAAIVVETTTAADIAGIAEEKAVCRVGKGPVVSFMDRATVYDRGYYRLAFELAEKNALPCQTKHAVAGGNDAGAVHVSRGGVRTAAVSVPCRYLHGPVGLIAEEDFHNTEKLLGRLAEEIAGGAG